MKLYTNAIFNCNAVALKMTPEEMSEFIQDLQTQLKNFRKNGQDEATIWDVRVESRGGLATGFKQKFVASMDFCLVPSNKKGK